MAKQVNMSNVVKGVAGGMLAGMAMGYMGKKMMEDKPKMKKKANKAMQTLGQVVDTAQYMFK